MRGEYRKTGMKSGLDIQAHYIEGQNIELDKIMFIYRLSKTPIKPSFI